MSSTPAEPPLEFLGRVEGTVDGSKVSATYKVEQGTDRSGDWEYTFVAKVPVHDLSTPSGNKLAVKIPGDRMRLDLQIDPDDPRSFDDKVTLDGDGYSQTLGVVAQGKMHAHARGMTTVVFDGVKVGKKYTCTIDPGREGPSYKLFVDLELKQDHLMPPEDDAAAGQSGQGSPPGQAG